MVCHSLVFLCSGGSGWYYSTQPLSASSELACAVPAVYCISTKLQLVPCLICLILTSSPTVVVPSMLAHTLFIIPLFQPPPAYGGVSTTTSKLADYLFANI